MSVCVWDSLFVCVRNVRKPIEMANLSRDGGDRESLETPCRWQIGDKLDVGNAFSQMSRKRKLLERNTLIF